MADTTDDASSPDTRTAARAQQRAQRPRRLGRKLLTAALVLVLAVVAFVGFQVWSFNRNLTRSSALDGLGNPTATSLPPGARPDLNVLVMGLDSRLDVHGEPLPADIVEALNAGDPKAEDITTADVLMVFHIPGDGSKATAVSIPRDDYVELVGCPGKRCKSKIKEAYGLAQADEAARLQGQGLTAREIHDRSREAGRRAQVQTVSQFLGVHIDHFVEVTMASFFQVAQVVQPIRVCILNDTKDSMSGADFKAGEQEITAQQAVSFVRQRRDTAHPMQLLFTDLDRARRQQAFIISVLSKLRSADTFANPVRIRQLLDVGTQNTVVDAQLDLMSFAGTAREMAGGKLSFYTLPVADFQTIDGAEVNIVDVPRIRATVRALFAGAAPPDPTSTGPATSGPTASGTTTSATSTRPTGRTSAPTTATSTFTPVPATEGGKAGPPPTALTELGSGGIPCVK